MLQWRRRKWIMAELWLTKTRPNSFYEKQNVLSETMPVDVNKVLKIKS